MVISCVISFVVSIGIGHRTDLAQMRPATAHSGDGLVAIQVGVWVPTKPQWATPAAAASSLSRPSAKRLSWKPSSKGWV